MSLYHFFLTDHFFSILTCLMLFSITGFLFSWLTEPRRLINGVFFTISLILFGVWLTFWIYKNANPLVKNLYWDLIIVFILSISLLVSFSWILCLWNAYFVWKYESHTLPNLLTLILGLILILIWVITLFGPGKYLPRWLDILLTAAPTIAFYLVITMYNFLVSSLLYQFVPRFYHQDYLVVLGAGLINGERVSPLLAARIDKAINFAHKQVKHGKKMPKIIMSGGQGGDEKISEAQAMANYALEQGIDAKDLLLEDKSKNTYQNMVFSKNVAQKDFGSDHFKAKFFSNNYHIFRAGLLAKQANFKINGIGSYTRFYFLPNATIREFAGVFVMHKKRHAIVIGLIILIYIIEALIAIIGLL